jgi:hypothetical protein
LAKNNKKIIIFSLFWKVQKIFHRLVIPDASKKERICGNIPPFMPKKSKGH